MGRTRNIKGSLSIRDIEECLKKMDILEIKYLGDGLYKLPSGIVANENFMEKLNEEIKKQINQGI